MNKNKIKLQILIVVGTVAQSIKHINHAACFQKNEASRVRELWHFGERISWWLPRLQVQEGCHQVQIPPPKPSLHPPCSPPVVILLSLIRRSSQTLSPSVPHLLKLNTSLQEPSSLSSVCLTSLLNKHIMDYTKIPLSSTDTSFW